MSESRNQSQGKPENTPEKKEQERFFAAPKKGETKETLTDAFMDWFEEMAEAEGIKLED